MGSDRFGRFSKNGVCNCKSIERSVPKSYVDECMKNLRIESDKQINSLITYNNHLYDIKQELYNKTIQNIETKIKNIQSKITRYNEMYTLDDSIEIIIKNIESKINKYNL